jgi:hypothetical protein
VGRAHNIVPGVSKVVCSELVADNKEDVWAGVTWFAHDWLLFFGEGNLLMQQ